MSRVAAKIVDRMLAANATKFEPSVDGGTADFGTFNGQQTVAELQDLVTLWKTRMDQLGNAFAAFSPMWVGRDLAAMSAWSDDWQKLYDRWKAADASANSAIMMSHVNPLPNYMIPAQSEFDALSKAMRQCYPPDGCPVQKGDWHDLFDRLTAATKAAGQAPPIDNPPQPTARDADREVLASTAPIDVLATATGAQAPSVGKGLFSGLLSGLYQQNKKAFIIGGVVLGGVVLLSLMPILLLPAKLTKVAAAAAI